MVENKPGSVDALGCTPCEKSSLLFFFLLLVVLFKGPMNYLFNTDTELLFFFLLLILLFCGPDYGCCY